MTLKRPSPETPSVVDLEEASRLNNEDGEPVVEPVVAGLRRLRIARGLTQKTLAFYSGVSALKISSLENGTVARLGELTQLAEVLRVPVSALFLNQKDAGDYTLTRIGELLGLNLEARAVMDRIKAGPFEMRHLDHLGREVHLSALTLRHVMGVSASTYQQRVREGKLRVVESNALLDAAFLVTLLELRIPGVPIEKLFKDRGFYQGHWSEAGGRFATLFDLQIVP